jgi:hypothetical protein
LLVLSEANVLPLFFRPQYHSLGGLLVIAVLGGAKPFTQLSGGKNSLIHFGPTGHLSLEASYAKDQM